MGNGQKSTANHDQRTSNRHHESGLDPIGQSTRRNVGHDSPDCEHRCQGADADRRQTEVPANLRNDRDPAEGSDRNDEKPACESYGEASRSGDRGQVATSPVEPRIESFGVNFT